MAADDAAGSSSTSADGDALRAELRRTLCTEGAAVAQALLQRRGVLRLGERHRLISAVLSGEEGPWIVCTHFSGGVPGAHLGTSYSPAPMAVCQCQR